MTFHNRVFDSLVNFVSKIGVIGGKDASNTYILTETTQQEINAAYRTSWLCRKVIDIPPLDMTREWRNWQADDNQIEDLENEEKRLALNVKVRRALSWARLYGGAALVLGVDQGQSNEPLDIDKVKKGQLKFVHVVSRWRLSALGIEMDPLSDNFNLPQMWQMNGKISSLQIHPSRVIRFIGNEIPDDDQRLDGWGDPLWMSLKDIVSSTDLLLPVIAGLVQEAKVDVIKVPDLMSLVGTKEHEDQLLKRFSLAMTMKSINNVTLLDGGSDGKGGEQWERKEIAFAGLTDIVDTFAAISAGAADIPATRLLGRSPKGLNATGESDLRNYYDMISSRQELEMWPAIEPLDKIMQRHLWGAVNDQIYFESAPLWQMTPAEKSATNKQKAETTQIYSISGLIPNDALAVAVQNQLVEDNVYPGLQAALEESKMEADVLIPAPEPAPTNVFPLVAPKKTATGDMRDGDYIQDPKTGLLEGSKPGGGSGEANIGDLKPIKGVSNNGHDPDTGLSWEKTSSETLIVNQVRYDGGTYHIKAGEKVIGTIAPIRGNKQESAEHLGKIATGRGEVIRWRASPFGARSSYYPNFKKALLELKRYKSKDSVEDAAPRSLYVRRDVRNAADIIEWAKQQGFETTLPADEMHVTICYSRQPIDWMKVGGDYWSEEKNGGMTINPGGPRIVEPLGPDGAIVLLFASSSLTWRHQSIRNAGASSDYGDDYQPHVTITYNKPDGLNLDDIEPYRDAIELGPEIFEEIDDNYLANLLEDEDYIQDPKTGLMEGSRPSGSQKSASELSPQEWHQRVEKNAGTLAKSMGFQGELIVHGPEEKKVFEVGGEQMVSAGSYTHNGGANGEPRIDIYSSAISPGKNELPGLMAHEVQHHRYHVVQDAIEADRVALEDDPKFSVGKALSADLQAKYPIYSRFAAYDMGRLKKDDGITAYSRQYWTPAALKITKADTAIHETLAEMAKEKLYTGELKGSGAWKSYYNDVQKTYKEIMANA